MGLSRTKSRLVTCPYCLAKPGDKCVREDGKPRFQSHQERVDAAFDKKLRPLSSKRRKP